MFITNTSNWPSFWPGCVGLEEGSRWIKDFEPNRLVTYTSAQKGLPDAFHERHFESDGEGFVYRLVVEYAPRAGINGVLDRILLPGIRRAFERTFVALDKLLSCGLAPRATRLCRTTTRVGPDVGAAGTGEACSWR